MSRISMAMSAIKWDNWAQARIMLSVNVYWVPTPDLAGIASSLFHKLGHWDLEVINKLYSFQAYLELNLFDFKAYILISA